MNKKSATKKATSELDSVEPCLETRKGNLRSDATTRACPRGAMFNGDCVASVKHRPTEASSVVAISDLGIDLVSIHGSTGTSPVVAPSDTGILPVLAGILPALRAAAQRASRPWRRRQKRWQGPGRKLQILRRSLQIAVLLLLILIPVLSLYDHLRNQRDEVGIQSRWDTRTVHSLVQDVEQPERFTQAVRGSVWTLKAGDFIISDPLAVVDFIAASRVLVDRFLITALIPVLLSLLLGRVFCGWLCPADLLFEAGSRIRSWAGIETDVRFSRRTKYALLALGLLAGLLLGTQFFAEIYPPRIISAEFYLWITFGVFGAGAWFFLLILAFEIFVSRRFWCRYVCPGGALYSLLGRWRVVRLKVQESSCTNCRLCDKACEFGLSPMQGKFGPECNNCGLCMRACPHASLSYRLSLPPRDGLDVVSENLKSA